MIPLYFYDELWITSSQGSIQFVMRVTDIDNSSTAIQTIDTLFVNLDALLPGDDFTTPVKYPNSNSGFLAATLSFRVQVCAENYYDPNCTKFCDANSREGNFVCNQDGDLVCLDGYYSLSTNCTECAPNHYGPTCSKFCDDNIQEGNFICNQVGDLICLDGYYNLSTNCTECVSKDNCCEYIYLIGMGQACMSEPHAHNNVLL